MGGTIPEDIDQDLFTGKNDLAFAAASSSTMLLDITRDQRKSRLKKINGAWKKTMLKLVASPRRLVWEHKARECPVFLTVMDTF